MDNHPKREPPPINWDNEVARLQELLRMLTYEVDALNKKRAFAYTQLWEAEKHVAAVKPPQEKV